MFDVLGLKETVRFGARVRIVEWETREAVAKIARFDFENAKDYSNDKVKEEIDCLNDHLVEDTGREDFSD
jgi:hypothetical protein